MSSSEERLTNEFFIDSSFSEMSLTSFEDSIQKPISPKKEEDVVKKIFKERQERRQLIKPGAPIYFNTSNQCEIINFYGDIIEYIKTRKRSSLSVYKTIVISLQIYRTQRYKEKDDHFWFDFSQKWLCDVGKLKEYLKDCSLSCDQKNTFYETLILLNLYFASLHSKSLHFDCIISLLQSIYFNSCNDRVLDFLNFAICDEFCLTIPNIIIKIYKHMNFQTLPLDMEHYCCPNTTNFCGNLDEMYKSTSTSSRKSTKPVFWNSFQSMSHEKYGKIQIGGDNLLNNEKKSKLKEERKRKLEDLLLSCGEESSSRYSNSYLLKLTERKSKKRRKESKSSLATDFSNLVESTKEKQLTLIVEEGKGDYCTKEQKILVPGTPEKILRERNLHRKRKHSFNSPLSISNNNVGWSKIVSSEDSKDLDSIYLRTPENCQNEVGDNKNLSRIEFSNIVLETPPHKIKCRRVTKELTKISDLAKKNLCNKGGNNSSLNFF